MEKRDFGAATMLGRYFEVEKIEFLRCPAMAFSGEIARKLNLFIIIICWTVIH